MNRQYRKVSALLAALFLLLSAAGCNTPQPADSSSASAGTGSDMETASAVEALTADPQRDEMTATNIELSDTGILIDGSGATADGSTLTVTAAGTYVLTGTLSGGQVVVSAGKEDTVQLVLDGVAITGGENAAIYCRRGDLAITLAEGSANTLADAGESYTYANAEDDEPNAALFSKNDLILGGAGSLTVSAGFNNGIGAKDHLVIESGVYHVTAQNHGIRGRDSVTVRGGDLTIIAGNDGIQSNNSGESMGWIRLEGGSCTITAAHDAVQAESDLTVTGGSYTITAGGGADTTPADVSGSYKGLKANGSIAISGGDFAIDTADDAVHANGDIAITGGALQIAAGDDGIHADGDLTIADGDILITGSYEGLEASTMTISGGAIDLTAADDGINIAGGNDSGGGGRFGADSFTSSGERWLHITGGHITVRASGDGLDSNGDIEMSGGAVYVHGPTRGGDAAIDYDGTFTLTGGTIAAAGSAGMAQMPGSDSTQPSIMVTFSSVQAGGTPVELRDAAGGALLTFTPEKDFQTIVLTAPEMAVGGTYTVITGGEKLLDIEISGVVTSISDTGEAVSGFGGRRGGMPGGDRGQGGPGGMGDGDRPAGDRDGERPAGGGGPPGGNP